MNNLANLHNAPKQIYVLIIELPYKLAMVRQHLLYRCYTNSREDDKGTDWVALFIRRCLFTSVFVLQLKRNMNRNNSCCGESPVEATH